jgi:uncharacterized protein
LQEVRVVLQHELIERGVRFWQLLVWILPYFFLGVGLGALVRTYKWHVRMRNQLPRFGFWGIFVAVGVGMISPLCACGVIPIVVSLMTAGMPLAPAMALVVASPLMSIEGYTITARLLGLPWANAKLVAALFMGLFAGLVTHLVTRWGFNTAQIFRRPIPPGDIHDPDYPDHDLYCDCNKRWSNRIARRYPNHFVIFLAKAAELTGKVGWFTLLGLAIEVVAEKYIPYDWMVGLFGKGNDLLTIPLITLGAAVLHVNQITAAGILYGPVDVLTRQGSEISKGAIMAFLIGGPVTALPVMGVFLSIFKTRVFLLYLGICFTGTLIVSYFYNLF